MKSAWKLPELLEKLMTSFFHEEKRKAGMINVLVFWPIIAIFASLGWLTFFCSAYAGLPSRLEASKRVWESISIASVLTVFVVAAVLLLLYSYVGGLF
jgi:hypothetical protein